MSPKDSVKVEELAVTIEPLGDRIIVMPLEKEQVSASGIVIPETTSKEKPHEGVVIALGKGGIMNDKGVLSPDPHKYLKLKDIVLFGRYAGDDVKLKSKSGKDIEVKILHLDSILGIVR
ncbi:MAG: co-chaperone GroES [Candidatus Peribacteraceae bacterium]